MLNEKIETIYDIIPVIDVDEVLEDEDVVNMLKGGAAEDQLREAIERQIDLTESKQCLMCERGIEDSTAQIVVVQGNGLAGCFCGGTCMLEFYGLQYLGDVYEETMGRVQRRAVVPFQTEDEPAGE